MVEKLGYRHGLAVMRAQPFHIGHKRIVDIMLEKCEQVTIALGSIQEFGTKRNPLSYKVREKMIKEVYKNHSDFSRINIVGLFDINSPLEWADYVIDYLDDHCSSLPKVDVYFAGSEYDASWYQKSFENVEIINRIDPDFPFVNGTMVREMIRTGDGIWKDFICLENHCLVREQFSSSNKKMFCSDFPDNEYLWKNLQEGFRDFCKENQVNKVILGLSGGLDSAIVSVLATQVLGGENVYAYMMKTKYTSDISLEIAQKIATLNGFNYEVLDIQDRVDYSYAHLKKVFGCEPKDVVMQNVQARARGDILMSLSNQLGYLVLACSNKSEISMGYCTLYGDVCGAVMPIGAVYKTRIFSLATWLNSKKLVLPEEVISRQPTAELAFGQKDIDNLPSYDVLDKILELHLENNKQIEDIVAMGYDFEVVNRIVKQYHKMAFKRVQIPYIIKI